MMRIDPNDCPTQTSLHSRTTIVFRQPATRSLWGPLSLILIFCLALASCDRSGSGSCQQPQPAVVTDTATHGKTMEQLLDEYGTQTGKQRLATANRIFGILYRMEFTDSLLKACRQTPPDSLNLMVWYWASEYFFSTQDYDKGLRYGKQAVSLARHNHDLTLRSDCEHTTGLLYFRLSDYAHAIEHFRTSLEISRKIDDKSRISSSLNSLAAISLVAKQLNNGEKYISEALSYSRQLNDSARMAIQYGMASEIHHTMGNDRQALNDARQAYVIDSVRGNKAKIGIRLSQMAAAEQSLGRYADAEAHVRKAMPLLALSGNNTSLAVCQNQMGELLNHKGAHNEAARHFAQAAKTFAQLKDKYNESRAQIGLFEAMKDNNPREAALHLRRYSLLKDSIYQHNLEQAVSQFNVKYKTEELAHQRNQDRLEKRNSLIVGLVLVGLLLLVIAWLLYTSRARSRHNRLMKKMSQMRERFFTNITHEFRTPLTLIIGLSDDLANDEECSASTKKKALTIHRQGNNLLHLINQLLDVAKIKSETGNANWRNGDVTAYLQMIVDGYNDYARSRNIDLHFIAKDTVVMDFVPDYVNKIMNNLLSNSMKFTPEYGKVGVTLWREGTSLLIDVVDNGKGMDKETTAHIFEPFYQAETDTQNIGTGIGLALVKQLVDKLEGTISAESRTGRGTLFQIALPIHQNIRQKEERQPDTTPVVPPQPQTVTTDSGTAGNECRILIIEDNPDVAAYISSRLAGQYAIFYAANGREGLEKSQSLVPDLIITDLMMPETDGLEVCRQVRANEVTNHIPIIVITAKITEEERLKGLEAGADAYLTKPFNAEELRIRVSKLLESRRLLQKKYLQLMSQDKDNADDSEQPCEADLRFLIKVSDIVFTQLNGNHETSVPLIASMMCMSNSQFYRKMVAVTGSTPVAYIQRVKIKRAMKILDEDDKISMAEVATRCGFDVYPNFVRAFKNVSGITPTEYRKKKDLE